MKKQLTIAVLAALFATTACATPEKPADTMMKSGMMQGDMMRDCPMMKDGRMKEGMSKDMMAQCHKMMKDGGMMGYTSSKGQPDSIPAGVSEEDHKKHHPAQ